MNEKQQIEIGRRELTISNVEKALIVGIYEKKQLGHCTFVAMRDDKKPGMVVRET